jgi:GTPase SAR1 family protein
MSSKETLTQRARQLSARDRMAHLMSLRETDMHKNLARLFSEIDKDATVLVTHSPQELGADLVVVRKDELRESVSSVVVNMGHLRGETGEKIERIQSQIKQCFDIPREISTRLDPVNTSEVWLVQVGEITPGARSRLLYQVKQEYRGTLTIFDIERLVNLFTKHYPEVFLGGDVVSFIEQRIQNIELKHPISRRASNLNLSEWYVEPYLSTGGIPIELDEAGKRLTIKTDKVQFTKLESIVKRESKVIVCGDPGVGKTTALSKLVLDMLREVSDSIVGGRYEEPICIPVMLSARDMLGCDDCDSLISKCTEKGELIEGFGISLVIIDGLDEVKSELRDKILEKTTELCTDMKCNLVIGTRKVEVIKNPPRGVSTFELLPFEVNQALKLFQRLVTDTRLLDTLREGLAKVRTQLPMTPISLILLIDTAEEHGEVPASLCDLYNRYFEMVLGKWDLRDKGIKSLFQYETKMHFLSELAWKEFLQKNKVEINKDEFDEFVRDYVARFGFDSNWVSQFVDEIQRAGIVELRDTVAFRHRSFLDYFIAFSIARKQDDLDNVTDLVTNLYFSDLWSDVTFFFVGINKALTQKTLEHLAKFDQDDLSTNMTKFSIGRLLQAGWLSTKEIKCMGVNIALEYLLPIREQLRRFLSGSPRPVGLILADFLPMAIAEWSMGSMTLRNALEEIARPLLSEASSESIWKVAALTWALWRFLTVEEQSEIVSNILENISKSDNISIQDKSALMLLMVTLEDKSKVIRPAINRRLRRLGKQHPALFKKLLPPVQQGFRRRPGT